MSDMDNSTKNPPVRDNYLLSRGFGANTRLRLYLSIYSYLIATKVVEVKSPKIIQ